MAKKKKSFMFGTYPGADYLFLNEERKHDFVKGRRIFFAFKIVCWTLLILFFVLILSLIVAMMANGEESGEAGAWTFFLLLFSSPFIVAVFLDFYLLACLVDHCRGLHYLKEERKNLPEGEDLRKQLLSKTIFQQGFAWSFVVIVFMIIPTVFGVALMSFGGEEIMPTMLDRVAGWINLGEMLLVVVYFIYYFVSYLPSRKRLMKEMDEEESAVIEEPSTVEIES